MFFTIFPLAAGLCHQFSEVVPEQPLGMAPTAPCENSTAPRMPVRNCMAHRELQKHQSNGYQNMTFPLRARHFLWGHDISFRDKTCSIFPLGASPESSTIKRCSARVGATEAVGHTGQDSPIPSCWCPKSHLPSGDHITFIDWAHSPLRCTCPFDFSIPIRVSFKQRSLLTTGTADATATTSWVYAIHLLC